MARKLTRSSRGVRSSSASFSTRRLNSSQFKSRSRKREPGAGLLRLLRGVGFTGFISSPRYIPHAGADQTGGFDPGVVHRDILDDAGHFFQRNRHTLFTPYGHHDVIDSGHE